MLKGSNISEEDLSDTPGHPRPASEYEYRPYRRLATAVIRQSIADYLRYWRTPKGTGRRQLKKILLDTANAEAFLYSEVPYWRTQRDFWFQMAGILQKANTVTELVDYYRENMLEEEDL
jgi:hypothetical protein